MSPEEIRIELVKRRRQTNMAKIGRQLNPRVSPQAVQRVIDRKSVSERIMLAIAVAIEQPAAIVFPEKEFNKQPI